MRNQVVAIVALAGAFSAQGDTYYVRTTGSNSNSGTTPADAFATVAYAADVAQAGDIVYVGGGTYTGLITPSYDGTSANPVRYYADVSGAQTGDAGSVVLQASSSSSQVLDCAWDDYQYWYNFIFDGGRDTVEWDGSVGGLLAGCTIRDSDDELIEVRNNATLTLQGCTLDDAYDDVIAVRSGTVTMTDCVVSDSGGEGLYVSGSSSNLSARRTRVLRTGNYGAWASQGDLTLINCFFYDTGNDAVRCTSSGSSLVMIGCTIDNCADDGVYLDYTTATVYGNIIADCNEDAIDVNSSVTVSHDYNILDALSDAVEGHSVGSNEIIADPQFVSSGGYALNASSLAIDAGMDLSAWTSVDITGASRPTGGGWEMGCWEQATAVYANTPYENDFEGSIGGEWTDTRTASTSDLGAFLGTFRGDPGNEATSSLNLNVTAGEVYDLVFDLYLFGSWNGSGSGGPDDVRINIDGAQVYNYTFDYAADGSNQTHPFEACESGNLGGSSTDTVYRRQHVTFTPASSTTRITFSSTVTSSSEFFSIDNIFVGTGTDAALKTPFFTPLTRASSFGSSTNSADDSSGSGIAAGDLDLDGVMELVISGTSSRIVNWSSGSSSFSSTTFGGGDARRQATLFDADDDGDLDMWVVAVRSPSIETLFQNNGSGLMIEAGGADVSLPSNNEGLAAADIDGNGRMDLVMFSENGNWILDNKGEDPVSFEATADGADGLTGAGLAGNGDYVSSADINGDGKLDFFYHYNNGRLFVSNGDGTYTLDNRGISVSTGASSQFGSAWGDYDNDGDADLFVPRRSSGSPGYLWRNNGTSFTDVTSSAGITDTSAQRSSAWGDYDNDGDLDLAITTESSSTLLVYENQGDGTFVQVDRRTGVTGDGLDVAFVDFDTDGDLDLALTRSGDRDVILRNETGGTNYVYIRAVREAGGEVIGARVELLNAAGDTVLASRHVGTARGFGGTEPVWAHFGGVTPTGEYSVRVTWPNGKSQTVSGVTPNSVQTTIGSTVIPRMLTITQEPAYRVVRWREVSR